MEPLKYTIIMFNMSVYKDWEAGIRNRNYFVMRELLKRDDVAHVIAVDYLPVSVKLRIKNIRERMKNHDAHVVTTKEHKLSVYSPINLKNIQADIEKHLATQFLIPNTQIIVWSYFPLFIDYFDSLPAQVKVFDAVDDWSKHPSYQNHAQRLRRNYQKILVSADVIFTVSEYLKEHVFNGSAHAWCIQNGVDADFFTAARTQLPLRAKNRHITVGYVGTIQSRVDFELVAYLAAAHPDKRFAFVGPVWDEAHIHLVKDLQNVLFTGRIPYQDLPRFFSRFDIGIIPHKVDEFTKSMDPMKFYDYLAWGLPVVSTIRLTKDKTLLRFAPDYDEFSRALDEVQKEDSDDAHKKRIDFALKNSWQARVDEMMRLITKAAKDKA